MDSDVAERGAWLDRLLIAALQPDGRVWTSWYECQASNTDCSSHLAAAVVQAALWVLAGQMEEQDVDGSEVHLVGRRYWCSFEEEAPDGPASSA